MTFKPYYEIDTKDPTGWISPADVSISYNKTARTITLTGTLVYYWQGTKHTLTSPWTSAAHDSADGRYFLYTTDGINFAWSTDTWSFFHAMVAIARKKTSPAYQFALREPHGLMPWQVHNELHELISAYRVSGGGLTAGTYTENTASDAANTPGFDELVMADEDSPSTIAAWLQGTYTTMRIGASNAVTFDTAASFPFRSSGSYILVNNTSTGAEAAAGNNQYVNVYIIRLPVTSDADSQAYRLVCLQPQRAFSSLASAQAEDTRSLSLGDLTPSIPEFVFYERITYVLASGDSNTGKCRIAPNGISYIYGSRMSQIAAPGFVTQTAENVPFTPAGSIAAINVQAALEELDTEKQAAGSYLTAANIEDAVVDGHTTIAPSSNAVFDALALKQAAGSYLTSANIEDAIVDAHTTIAPSGNAVFDALALKMALAGGTFSGNVTFADAVNIILNTTTGTKIGTATNQKLGFFNAAPVVQAAAYTQTASAATRTVALQTAATLTDNSGGTANTTLEAIGTTYSQTAIRNNFADLASMVNKLTADNVVLIRVLTSVIDDLQALGLVG